MTSVTVNTYTHSVTYVADNILKSIKNIILQSGLDPENFVGNWPSNLLAVKTWLSSGDLERVVLEIYNPQTNALITRWDIDIAYGWSGDGGGGFWTDTEQLKYAIKKTGLAPSQARYRLLLNAKAGRPDVPGWSDTSFLPTDGMIRQSLGATVEHNGLGANTSYLRRA